MPAAAQFTSVSATVTDPNGLAYAGATVKAQLVPGGVVSGGQATVTVSNAQQCISSGFGSAPCKVPIQSTYGPITLTQAGAFTLTLPDVTLVNPASSQWILTFNIAPGIPPPGGTGPQTFTYTSTGTLISGASVNLSAQISANAVALGFASGAGIPSVASLPATCTPAGSNAQVNLNTGAAQGLYSCTSTNTYTYIGSGAASALTFNHITTNASTVVRSGSGMLGVIQVNNPGAGWTVQIFDNTSCTGTQIGLTTSLLAIPGRTLNYYVTFNTGLCIITSGTTPGDLSVGFTSTPGTFNYSNITANASTQIKSAAGNINWIQVNNPGAGWLLTLFDNTSCNGTVIAALPALLQGASPLIKFNAHFNTGLCAVTTGTIPGNLTVASN